VRSRRGGGRREEESSLLSQSDLVLNAPVDSYEDHMDDIICGREEYDEWVVL